MNFSFVPKFESQKSLTAYWENFLSNEEIQILINHSQWENCKQGKVGEKEEINERRKSEIVFIYPTQELIYIWEKLGAIVEEVNKQFFGFELTGFYEGAQLTMYKEEYLGKYDWHTDYHYNIQNPPRKLSMSLLLSDPSEFEGGELQITRGENSQQSLEQKQGRAWFFPSYLLHRVTPITKGCRKSLVLWIHGPDFK